MFEKMLAEHYNRLLAYVERRIDPRLDRRVGAAGVLHEGLEHARQRWLKGERPVGGRDYVWLFQKVRDQMIAVWRHHTTEGRDVQREVMPLPAASSMCLAAAMVDPGAGPQSQAEQRETTDRVHRIMAEMKSEDSEVIELRGLAELSYEEIGVLLDLPANTVCRRYLRAIERFRAAWEAAS